jgi:hypothetical protein
VFDNGVVWQCQHWHRLYFRGYAMWNYVAIPFMLAGEGLALRERTVAHATILLAVIDPARRPPVG